jgi:hypothetical protein
MNNEKLSNQALNPPLSKGDVTASTDLKVGDKIDIGGFITTLEEIKYDPHAKIGLYWFWNERGEYKYNVRDFITKV